MSMNKLTFLRLNIGVEYEAVCVFRGECVIEKTKSSERDGTLLVTYPNGKVKTRHYKFFTVKGEK